MWRVVRQGLVIPILCACLSQADRAQAQSAAQITPPTFRPAAPRAGSALVFTGQPGLEAPAGADRLIVVLSGLQVEGGLPDLDHQLAALRTRLVGRPIPASEIFAAARDLEASYSRAGYVLVRVVLPVQTLHNGGRLRLVVVDGYIEKVDYSDIPERVRTRIAAVVDTLVGRRGLRLADIERKLMIAGDTPGVSLRSTLKAGTKTGATTLVLDARYRMFSAFLGGDNTLSGQLGRSNETAGIDVNSVFFQGEQIYFRAAGHIGTTENGVGGFLDEYPRVRTLAAGIVVPLGTDGLTFNLEGVNSRTTPKPPAGLQVPLNSYSTFNRVSARLRYPWIRSRTLTFSSEASFDVENETQGLIAGEVFPIAKDRVRVFRLSSDLAYNSDSSGYFTANVVVSFGIAGLGARTADATRFVPLTRQGADADFQKVELSASYSKPLMDHLTVSLYARGQTSFNQPLPQAEQIGIASFQELSTFDAGTLGGDSGWVIRGEVSSPWLMEGLGWPLTITPYVLLATGTLYNVRPTLAEQGTTRVSSIGMGVRLLSTLDPAFSQLSLTLEYGRAFRDDQLPNSNRFTAVGTVRF